MKTVKSIGRLCALINTTTKTSKLHLLKNNQTTLLQPMSNSRNPTMPIVEKATISAIFLLTAVTLIAYHEILSWVVKGWFTLNNAYSFVILLLFLYMIWQKKEHLRQLPAQPNILIGVPLVTFGCSILIVGNLTSTLLLQGISFVFSLLGLVWLILGNHHVRVLWIPVGYLVFMFYLFEEVLGNFSLYFQNAAAWIAARLLGLGGMPVALNGHLIELPHISLEVAKVCNGINHMLALVAIAIPFAFASSLSRSFKIIVVAAAVAIGIIANGLRVTMIGIWSKYYPDGPLHGPFDIFYVSFILVFGLIFFALVKVVSIKFGTHQTQEAIPRFTAHSTVKRMPPSSLLKATVVGLFLFGSTGTYLLWHNPQPVSLNYRLSDFPQQIGPWRGQTVFDKDWPIKHLSADDELKRIYIDPSTGTTLGLYVGYFRSQHQGKELIGSHLSWLHLREKRLLVQLERKSITISRGKARGMDSQTYEGDKRLFYFWYVVDGKAYIDRYGVKLKLLAENMLRNRTNGAIVVVSLENIPPSHGIPDTAALEFIGHVFPLLEDVFTFSRKT
jgi:EpsI family protein